MVGTRIPGDQKMCMLSQVNARSFLGSFNECSERQQYRFTPSVVHARLSACDRWQSMLVQVDKRSCNQLRLCTDDLKLIT